MANPSIHTQRPSAVSLHTTSPRPPICLAVLAGSGGRRCVDHASSGAIALAASSSILRLADPAHDDGPREDVDDDDGIDDLTRSPSAQRGIAGFMARAAWWGGAMLICTGLASAGFMTGALAAFLEEAPAIDALENYNPPEMTVLKDRDGGSFARLYEQRRTVVPLRELPPLLPDAFIAIEDTDFRHHVGLNLRAMARAMVINVSRGKMSQGASTITQQLPRNLLPEIGREKTMQRKAMETLVALQMERRYSKDQILEVYLNHIYLGSGAYGVEAAAQTYFGKSARDLKLQEIALLAGLPQIPEQFSPLNNPEAARRRRDLVLGRLHDLDWISDDEYADAATSPIEIAGGTSAAASDSQYFVDAVRAEISRDLDLDAQALREDGWTIETTMDPVAQRLAMVALREGLDAEESQWIAARAERFASAQEDESWEMRPTPGQVRMATVVRVFNESLVVELPGGWRADLPIPAATAHFFTGDHGLAPGDGVDIEITKVEDTGRPLFRGHLLPRKRMQGSLVCLDRRTGEVQALAGGRDYADRANDGYFNRAIHARRQAGSTLKPFFFAAALESGMTPDSIVIDEPISFANGYTPRNYENMFFGPTSLQVGLEHSRNVVTIKLALQTGLVRSLSRVSQFDFTQGAPHWKLPREMAVPLGTSGVTPLEIAAAYLPLANGGDATTPTTVRRVLNSSQRPVPAESPKSIHLMDDRVEAQMMQMLVGVMSHGTGENIRAALPPELQDAVAGKTGTTSDNRDAWFAGFTPDHVVVVWVGFDQPLPLGDHRTGGKVAGPIWARFVSDLWAAEPSPETQSLPMPDGWRLALIDLTTGEEVINGTAGGDYAWRARRGDEVLVAEAVPQAVPIRSSQPSVTPVEGETDSEGGYDGFLLVDQGE